MKRTPQTKAQKDKLRRRRPPSSAGSDTDADEDSADDYPAGSALRVSPRKKSKKPKARA